jgi:hypothetical protein
VCDRGKEERRERGREGVREREGRIDGGGKRDWESVRARVSACGLRHSTNTTLGMHLTHLTNLTH